MTPSYIWKCFKSWLPDFAKAASYFASTKQPNTILIITKVPDYPELLFTVLGDHKWILKTLKE
jgi:hypothetical protein